MDNKEINIIVDRIMCEESGVGSIAAYNAPFMLTSSEYDMIGNIKQHNKNRTKPYGGISKKEVNKALGGGYDGKNYLDPTYAQKLLKKQKRRGHKKKYISEALTLNGVDILQQFNQTALVYNRIFGETYSQVIKLFRPNTGETLPIVKLYADTYANLKNVNVRGMDQTKVIIYQNARTNLVQIERDIKKAAETFTIIKDDTPVETIVQTLKTQSELIATLYRAVFLPAANGYFAYIGNLDFKLQNVQAVVDASVKAILDKLDVMEKLYDGISHELYGSWLVAKLYPIIQSAKWKLKVPVNAYNDSNFFDESTAITGFTTKINQLTEKVTKTAQQYDTEFRKFTDEFEWQTFTDENGKLNVNLFNTHKFDDVGFFDQTPRAVVQKVSQIFDTINSETSVKGNAPTGDDTKQEQTVGEQVKQDVVARTLIRSLNSVRVGDDGELTLIDKTTTLGKVQKTVDEASKSLREYLKWFLITGLFEHLNLTVGGDATYSEVVSTIPKILDKFEPHKTSYTTEITGNKYTWNANSGYEKLADSIVAQTLIDRLSKLKPEFWHSDILTDEFVKKIVLHGMSVDELKTSGLYRDAKKKFGTSRSADDKHSSEPVNLKAIPKIFRSYVEKFNVGDNSAKKLGLTNIKDIFIRNTGEDFARMPVENIAIIGQLTYKLLIKFLSEYGSRLSGVSYTELNTIEGQVKALADNFAKITDQKADDIARHFKAVISTFNPEKYKEFVSKGKDPAKTPILVNDLGKVVNIMRTILKIA